MDWFERLTGFRETSYDDTRAKLKVDGGRLQSLINGKSYGIGELELVPLRTLRERVDSEFDLLPHARRAPSLMGCDIMIARLMGAADHDLPACDRHPSLTKSTVR